MTASPAIVAERLKERVYATLTVMAVALGLAQAEHQSHARAAVAVLATALGLWLATIVADQQAHRVVYGSLARGAELRRLLFVSSPLLAAAVGPLVLIGLSALGAMELPTALYSAAWLSAGSLFVWGCAAGLRMGGGRIAAVVVGLMDLAVGAVVVLVKLAAGH
ncbi:hypothetical protein C7C46_31795 [Streptomyces tateyamensis]|uniref:Uncharacterized protein n=1 Tax=Streptomyces tateyamensis TaxID=565073 RepID=A0A2V4NI25_9ACTN|nr:hypothetical protein C7C46_31795 [Streptomyces tateyamensis]